METCAQRRGVLVEAKNREFIYIVHDVHPALTATVLCRRAGRRTPAENRALKCPQCGKALTFISSSIKVELFRNPKRNAVSCHEYVACGDCGNEVGIRFAFA